MLRYFLLSVVLWSAVQCESQLLRSSAPLANVKPLNLTHGSRALLQANRSKRIPDGYVAFPETGSAFKLNVWQLPWNKARHICFSEGGQLAIINSIAERNVLYQLMELSSVSYAWLGAHDLYENNDWTTVTGIPLAATGYSTWKVGEPNNAGGNEHCVDLWNTERRGMNDIDCATLRAFICEVQLS